MHGYRGRQIKQQNMHQTNTNHKVFSNSWLDDDDERIGKWCREMLRKEKKGQVWA